MPLTVKNFKINSSAGQKDVRKRKTHSAGFDFAPQKMSQSHTKENSKKKVNKKDRMISLSLKIAS